MIVTGIPDHLTDKKSYGLSMWGIKNSTIVNSHVHNLYPQMLYTLYVPGNKALKFCTVTSDTCMRWLHAMVNPMHTIL